MKGKDKCELLRSIRQSIAELNGIQYSPKECDHDECSIGTCPLCEEEVFWLMDELRKKEAAGSPINIDSESLFVFELLSKEPTDDEEELEILMGIPAPLEGDILPSPPEEDDEANDDSDNDCE